MSVQMQRVNVIARVAEFEAIAPSRLQRVGRPHGLHGERFPIERPLVEPVASAALFLTISISIVSSTAAGVGVSRPKIE